VCNQRRPRVRATRIRAQYPNHQSGECCHRRSNRDEAEERASSNHTRDRKLPRVISRPRRDRTAATESKRQIVMVCGAARNTLNTLSRRSVEVSKSASMAKRPTAAITDGPKRG